MRIKKISIGKARNQGLKKISCTSKELGRKEKTLKKLTHAQMFAKRDSEENIRDVVF
jgi:hypothetical protein